VSLYRYAQRQPALTNHAALRGKTRPFERVGRSHCKQALSDSFSSPSPLRISKRIHSFNRSSVHSLGRARYAAKERRASSSTTIFHFGECPTKHKGFSESEISESHFFFRRRRILFRDGAVYVVIDRVRWPELSNCGDSAKVHLGERVRGRRADRLRGDDFGSGFVPKRCIRCLRRSSSESLSTRRLSSSWSLSGEYRELRSACSIEL